jgi:hypothetical protein
LNSIIEITLSQSVKLPNKILHFSVFSVLDLMSRLRRLGPCSVKQCAFVASGTLFLLLVDVCIRAVGAGKLHFVAACCTVALIGDMKFVLTSNP